MIYMFTQCPKVKELWINILSWIEHKLSVKLEFDTVAKVLGYPTQNEHFWPLNFVLMITKQYIFSCRKNKEKTFLVCSKLQNKNKNKNLSQMSIVKINCLQKMGVVERSVHWIVM